MTEDRIVPVKSWLKPTTYRALEQHAQRVGLNNVGELLTRIAERLVTSTAPPAKPPKKHRAATYSTDELIQRRLERQRAFFADENDPRHGTHNGYTNLRCRCPRCREASATFKAAKRARS